MLTVITIFSLYIISVDRWKRKFCI